MTLSEERIQILKMVRNGQVTAEEAAQLLEALNTPQEKREPPSPIREPHRLRIKVSNLETGEHKVNINLPWNLVNVGMHMGARFTPKEINLEDILQALRSGTEGKILHVDNEEDNERVEIFVE